jgi:hypothetical protein
MLKEDVEQVELFRQIDRVLQFLGTHEGAEA